MWESDNEVSSVTLGNFFTLEPAKWNMTSFRAVESPTCHHKRRIGSHNALFFDLALIDLTIGNRNVSGDPTSAPFQMENARWVFAVYSKCRERAETQPPTPPFSNEIFGVFAEPLGGDLRTLRLVPLCLLFSAASAAPFSIRTSY